GPSRPSPPAVSQRAGRSWHASSMPSLRDDLVFRGLVHQESAGLPELLDGPPLTAYHGIDPTAASLHIGNLYGICTLKRLQHHGHRPIALAGGGTGMIGDPGGRDSERPVLSIEEHRANMEGIRSQLEGLLDFSPHRGDRDGGQAQAALLLDNADWLSEYRLVGFLRDIGKHFSVNQMIQKESVRSRIDRPEVGISFTEFSYMLLQACDFLHLYDHFDCKLQIGGSDQWGNITMGIELIRKVRQGDAHGFTWPLLVSGEGRKYGKSVPGAVWLDPGRTSPFSFYQHFVRTFDDEVGTMLRYLTFLGHDEIEELDRATTEHPQKRLAQSTLARQVCTFVHGPIETARAERASAALYSEEISDLDEALLLEVVADAPSSTRPRGELDGDGVDLASLFAAVGLSPSKGAARRVISEGGAYVNNTRRPNPQLNVTRSELLHDRYVLLRRGRRDYHLVRFE
ncbi:MAG: tyrosine--tRNA ligase, partial [Acidimicrobiales bacterium]